MYKPPENKYGWKPDSERGNRHQRGYGRQWEKIRAYVLAESLGMCANCLKQGRYTKATQVDHIVPKAKGGEDTLSNLQPLCEPCHKIKTAHDNGHRIHQGITEDGTPIDPDHHWNKK